MRYVIAETDDQFDRIFHDTGVIAEFANEEQEKKYMDVDSALIEAIKNTCQELVTDNEEVVHHIEDWWPNHTRYVECSVSAFDVRLIRSLHALLIGKYDCWRIQIVVYEGGTQIGSIVIGSQWSLVDRALFERAQLTLDDNA
ncbi:MAG TPA: hypothetical protein VMP01_28035 [Pirellulaceae bacterium]|nr:hypothetical protein [Pirellulaceae bacterium]